MKNYTDGKPLDGFRNMKITPICVDHSALDAYMLYIEACGKRILFTGDFRDHGMTGYNTPINVSDPGWLITHSVHTGEQLADVHVAEVDAHGAVHQAVAHGIGLHAAAECRRR